jgi:membrane protein DedA with SNARE-associated domain
MGSSATHLGAAAAACHRRGPQGDLGIGETVGVRFAVITELIEWVRPFFATFGYAIVSGATFFESAALTGIVVPGDIILALGGVYAGRGDLAVGGVIGCGALFGLLGESTGYLLGRRYGDGVLRRAPLLRRFESKIDEAERSIESNAGKTIVVGRFVTGAAGLVPFAAGASGVGTAKFFAYTVPTICVWATAITLLGMLVGNNVEAIDRILSGVGWIGLAVVVTLVGLWLWRHRSTSHRG